MISSPSAHPVKLITTILKEYLPYLYIEVRYSKKWEKWWWNEQISLWKIGWNLKVWDLLLENNSPYFVRQYDFRWLDKNILYIPGILSQYVWPKSPPLMAVSFVYYVKWNYCLFLFWMMSEYFCYFCHLMTCLS